MQGFVDVVVDRYGALHATSELPWAAEPDIAKDCAIMPIQSALAGDVFPIVRDLSRERGLVCFDPQGSTVYQEDMGGDPSVSTALELSNGGKSTSRAGFLSKKASVSSPSRTGLWFSSVERTSMFR